MRVGIEKEHGLSPDSKMVVLHDFAPCVDDELEVILKDVKPPTQVERAPAIPDAGFGTLEIRLAYENPTSSLAVTMLRARGLIGMDMTGLSDPFCRLEVLPRG